MTDWLAGVVKSTLALSTRSPPDAAANVADCREYPPPVTSFDVPEPPGSPECNEIVSMSLAPSNRFL